MVYYGSVEVWRRELTETLKGKSNAQLRQLADNLKTKLNEALLAKRKEEEELRQHG